MNKSMVSFIKNSGIFFIGSALSKVIVFFLLPLYTNYISTENYGYYDLSVAYITVFTSVLYFDIWSTVLRFMYDSKGEEHTKKVVNACWAVFCVSTVVYIAAGCTFCALKSIDYWPLILGYGLSVNLHNMCSFIARGYKKNIHFTISGTINTAVMVAGNLIMILGLKMEIESLYISAIIGNVAQCIYLVAVAKVQPSLRDFCSEKTLFKEIILYTLPLCVNSVSYWLLTSYNRTVIEDMIGLSANGIYAIGNKFGSAISLVTTCFTYAWQDMAFSKQQNNKNNGAFYGKACGVYFAFLAVGISFMLPCFSVLFPYLVGDSYSEAYGTIPLFLIMSTLSAFSTFVGNVFYAIKDTKSIFISMMISCVCNLLICRFLISSMGINGANLAITISFILNILLRAVILKKKIKIKISPLSYILSSAIVAVSSFVYMSRSTWFNLVLAAVLIVSAGILFIVYRKKKKDKAY